MYCSDNIVALSDYLKPLLISSIAYPQEADRLFAEFDAAETAPIRTDEAIIYQGSDAVTEYVRCFRKCCGDIDNREALRALAGDICGKYRSAKTEMPDMSMILEIMTSVLSVFPEIGKIIALPLKVLLLDAQKIGRNAESTLIRIEARHQNIICLYRKNRNSKYTPTQIFLHEIGHLLHINITGTVKEVPASFREHLASGGADVNALPDEQFLEAFADTFLIAFAEKSSLAGDPFPKISPVTKSACLQYIERLIKNRE